MEKIISIIITIIFILFGLFFKFKKGKENKFKSKNLKSLPVCFVYNFIGNELLCQSITFILYILLGYTNVIPYICAAVMSMFALILHIHDVTGKSIEVIFDKIQFTAEDINSNIFVRITLFFSIIIIILGLIISKIL